MEDSGIDSGDAKPISDISTPLTPSENAGAPVSRLLQGRLGRRNRNQEYKKSSGSLLPLQRLPIPGSRECQPLVAWDTDESEEEVVSFFPAKPGCGSSAAPLSQSQELLTDSFSVEELSATDEDEDGDDLELVLPPGPPPPVPWLPCCLATLCCFM